MNDSMSRERVVADSRARLAKDYLANAAIAKKQF